jgi:hypothetical protein
VQGSRGVSRHSPTGESQGSSGEQGSRKEVMIMKVLEEALALERTTHPEETDEQLCDRLILETKPFAEVEIIDLCFNAHDPEVRQEASDYIFARATTLPHLWKTWTQLALMNLVDKEEVS